MPSISDEFVPKMIAAAEASLGKNWPTVRSYAEAELEKLAVSLRTIQHLAATKQINDAQARALLEIHKNNTKMVLLTLEGLGLLAVEEAVNAALAAIRDAFNKTIGFPLL